MGRGSIVSFGLFVLPIAITAGVLVGLDAFRASSGQPRLFRNNKINVDVYCQRAYGIHPTTDGQDYTLNPNQWGWNEGDPGALCVNVTTFGNGTYPTNTIAPEFSITWQYPPGPPTQPVHAFPNIKIDEDGVFPVQISSISNIDIDSSWMYSVGDAEQVTTALDQGALAAAAANTNVAIDMFLDSDSTKSTSTEDAKYEVMVWLATFGAATQPIGLAEGAKSVVTIGTTTFNLYFGVNGLGQTVLTWAATAPVTEFTGNIAPLLQQDISSFGGPSTTDYLGYVAFGSEALSAASNITLSVPRLSMQVIKA